MGKRYSLTSLLITVLSVLFVIFISSIQTGAITSSGEESYGGTRVASWNDNIAMRSPSATTNMLQLKSGGHLLGFESKKVYLASLDHALSVEFLGTRGVMPRSTTGGKETGDNPKAPYLTKVIYEELWEGISLTYEAREGEIAESTYCIKPWADVSKIRLAYNVPVKVKADGSLKFKFDRGYLTESPPKAWQDIGGKRVPVKVAFRVKGDEVGFSMGSYDPHYSLTIDPTYSWHTFYGSSGSVAESIAIDGSGNLYVTGTSYATWNGPNGESPLHAYNGSGSISVLKLNSSGAYQWHTFYGLYDEGHAIATDGNGNIYVTGYSYGTWNGPAGQSPLHAYSGGWDIFVLKLDPNGVYQWHTFYGSSRGIGSPDQAYSIATDGSGNVYVTGTSYETWNGPAGQAPLHSFYSSIDIFVLKLDSSGAYQWHTFYGAGFEDYGNAIVADGGGNLYVTGTSYGTWNGPAGQSPLHTHSGGTNIFVLKLDSSGAYQWHTFYGAIGSLQYSNSITIDGSGNLYVTGRSNATWSGAAGENPLHAFSGFFGDIFVLRLDSGGAYHWHTFYGSSGDDEGHAIATDGNGNIYVTGCSSATWNGPEGESPLHSFYSSIDIFVLKLDRSGAYHWHIFYGSNVQDYGNGIATDGSGNLYVTGTSSATWNGPDGENPLHAFSGSFDISVLKLNDPGSLPAVILVSPSGTITTATPTYTWNAISNATDYQIQVNDPSGMRMMQWYTAAACGCGSGSGTCSVTPAITLNIGAGQWWVRAQNSVATGPWSTGMSFTVSLPPPPAATLVSPTGTITTATPTYIWNAVSSSTLYYLSVNDSTGNRILQWYTAQAAGCPSGTGLCSATPGIALSSGAGSWKVQTYNGGGYGPWSTSMAFAVDIPGPPPAPVLLSPSGTITSTNPTYTWNAASNATDYQIQINDSSGMRMMQWYTAAACGCGSGTGTCSITPAVVLNTGACQWWAQAKNASGTGPWSSGMSFTVSLPPPPAATLISPTGTITTATPTYTWNAVSSSTWYYLSVNDSTGNRILQWYTASAAGCPSGAGTCSVTPSVSLNAGAGSWKVQTYNGGGYGPWSTPMSFTVNIPSSPSAPTLISPSGTVTTTSPTYTWNAISNATDYQIQINDSSGMRMMQWYTAAACGCASGTGTCSITPAIVLNTGACQWWAQAKNTAGTSSWSSGMSFTVSLPPPPAATLISPTGTITTATPTYTWNAVSSSTWYYLSVNDSTGNRILQWYTASAAGCPSGTGTCSVTPSVSLNAGAASWKLQTWSSAGYGPWSSSMSFMVDIPAPPPAPVLVSPSGTISTTSPTYTWNAISNATDYQIQINDSSGMRMMQWYTAAACGCASGTGTCSITPAIVLNTGACQWWAQARNAAGIGPWSTGMSFSVQGSTSGPLGAAILISPSGSIATNTPTYSWNAVSASTWYNLYVNDSTGNRIQQWYTSAQCGCVSGTGTCSITASTVLNSGAGRWWIQTNNSAGLGPWSAPMDFTVP